MDAAAKANRLRKESARQREFLIEADIETAMAFLRLAATELGMGRRERAADLVKKAGRARDVIANLLAQIPPEQKPQLREKWRSLDAAIRDAERHSRGPTGISEPG